MEFQTKDFFYVINKNVECLQETLNMHKCLVSALAGQKIKPEEIKQIYSIYSNGKNEKILKEAIQDAINELEESRKSFKSKRLEKLRLKLVSVLGQCS
jgi:type I site-specific restriction-modification system R (restriction) subunit